MELKFLSWCILHLFYINYVICKCQDVIVKVYNRTSFILTMWYVNVKITIKNAINLESFILTMWYVNSWLTFRIFLQS